LWNGRVGEMKDEASGNVMRVLIADDEPRVRSALRLLLRQHPGVAVAGEANSVERALELTVRQRPDLVLLDWELSGRNGTATLERLRAVRRDLMVIALSGRPEARQTALDAGVDAFVSKGDPPELLVATLQKALRVASRGASARGHPSCVIASRLQSP
jgi:DNA-binding NarL/FixJ family response regulator